MTYYMCYLLVRFSQSYMPQCILKRHKPGMGTMSYNNSVGVLIEGFMVLAGSHDCRQS